MIKYIYGVILVTLIGCFGNQNEYANRSEMSSEDFISDTLKSSISKSAKEYFSNAHIFAVRITKLYKSTIIGIDPIYTNNYLSEYGNPGDAYIYNGSLFLIYCGIEVTKNFSIKYKDELRNQFDIFCSQNGIGANEGVIHDSPPLFLKVQGSSLLLYNNGTERDFYNSYFELKEVKPFFTPDKKLLNDK